MPQNVMTYADNDADTYADEVEQAVHFAHLAETVAAVARQDADWD